MKKYLLYLDSPASEWELATPVGCGSLGAMLYGGVSTERIQYNEEFIWAGGKLDTDFPGFRAILDETRRLLLDGKGADADAYAEKALDGHFHRVASYETAGELLIELHGDDECSDYRRELDLVKGVADISYKKDGASYKYESFASYPARLIATKISVDKVGALSFTARFERENITGRRVIGNDTLEIKGMTATGEHEFTLLFKFIVEGGKYSLDCDGITVENADSAVVLFTAATEKVPSFPRDTDYAKLLDEHIADHSAIMSRSDVTLGKDDPALDGLPVSRRLKRLRDGETDGGLCALYFQFGKYLLVGSSRPGSLPANLQGVWSGYMTAPWNADYHTNINLQMNYWPAEVANIGECTLPLFDYMNKFLLEPGKRVARVNYHCRGTVLHHLSDVYGFAAPADGLWGLWPLGGAWLCYHMWEHYLFTKDEKYLRETAYEYIAESARFFLDAMYKDENGRLWTGPSTSPENRYFQNGKSVYLCMSPTMDVEIIGGLLRFYVECEDILGINAERSAEAAAALSMLPPLKIGKHGQLMEWVEDYDEPEPGHRHISHMFGLYPGDEINPDRPEIFAGAKKTLERRLANGGGHTGWSAAWLISLHARLLDGEGVYAMLTKLLTHSTRDNLFDSHPPFQIDGNFGGAAAIAEFLVQSQNGKIIVLPALPKRFNEGSFEGLRVRGGAELSAKWENGVVTWFKLKALTGGTYTLVVNGKTSVFRLDKDKAAEYTQIG